MRLGLLQPESVDLYAAFRDRTPDARAGYSIYLYNLTYPPEMAVSRSQIVGQELFALDPQTLAYGLMDSPLATAAWIWERRRNWSDCDGDVERAFSREHLCTTAALYWGTGAITSSLRLYHEQFTKSWAVLHDRMPRLEAPTAMAVFPIGKAIVPNSEAYKDGLRVTPLG